MITLPFTSFFFFLHVLIEFLPQPHLVHQVSDRQALISMLYDRLNGTLLLVIQALKKLSLSLSLPFLPALFRQPTSSHCSPSSLVSEACSSPTLHLRGREQTSAHTSWSESLWRCHSRLCIFLSASLECWQRAAQPARPILRPRSRMETCSRKMCCRLMMNSFVTCMNCYL